MRRLSLHFGVTLTLVLLAGSASALVPGKPPIADFVWSPDGARAGDQVTFTSTSTDPDGVILLHRWILMEDDETHVLSEGSVTKAFPRKGSYSVTLEVTDATLATSSITRTLTIANTPPVASVELAPSPAFRGQSVSFLGSATDADGDAIPSWTWDTGDGRVASGRNVTHAYTALGRYTVTLTVLDEDGAAASSSAQIRILNRPPQIVAQYHPQAPRAGEVVTFEAVGIDPDVPGGPVTFAWHFSDGPTYAGDTITHAFSAAGNYTVTVQGKDSEGGVSAPYVLAVRVDPA